MKNSSLELWSILKQLLADREHLHLLEAGCGSFCRVPADDRITITGIDISEKQLERNRQLDIKILGDIQNYSFSEETYDVIACRFVLEHLREPARAMENLHKALKKGGIMIITVPNLFSLKGLVTKFTPFWFHAFFYRHIYFWEGEHEDDLGPFKTYLRTSMTPSALKRFARKNNMEIVHVKYYDVLDYGIGDKLRKVGSWLYWAAKSLFTFLKIITFCRIRESDFLAVFQKKA